MLYKKGTNNRSFSSILLLIYSKASFSLISRDTFARFHSESDTKELELQKSGILNAHLCLNAQTRIKHTECDSSCTVISVPHQIEEKTTNSKFNKAEFKFNISDKKAIVLPLRIGTIWVYSGYLLTHRQQIKKRKLQVLL